MATALSAQLSAIAATSTNQLDLKAQRRAHSQSLIFDPHIAATQDFDTIYDFCVEGYHELCRLEPRFSPFSKSIFSLASKSQERSRMTAAQNEELNKVLEQFLLLVGSKVLLQPAVKALDWLIRRFRIHENNTEYLILTFLPYHTLPMFATLLSILPKRLSPAFKFLGPYLAELKPPPAHVVIYSATNNTPFFNVWNNYILKCCWQRVQYQTMVAYWASVMAEAIAGQLNKIGSAKVQSQKEEDVMHRILPVLSKGMGLKHAPEMRIACYILFSVLASKANFEEHILLSMLNQIAIGIQKDTSHAALICLTVIAQKLDIINFPTQAFESIMAINTLPDDLLMMSERYNVSNLATALVLKILHQARAGISSKHDQLVVLVIQQKLVNETQILPILENMLRLKSFLDSSECTFSAQLTHFSKLVQQVLAYDTVISLLNRIRKEGRLESDLMENIFDGRAPVAELENPSLSMEIEEATESIVSMESWNDLVKNVTTEQITFLSDPYQEDFDVLARAFSIALKLEQIEDFIHIPVLRRSDAMKVPSFLSFFVRYSCGPHPGYLRAAAIGCLVDALREAKSSSQAQIIIPCLLCVLADRSSIVRRAAIGLALALGDALVRTKESSGLNMEKIHFYGSVDAEGVDVLQSREVSTFVSEILGSNLEECSLDPTHIQRIFRDALNSSGQPAVTNHPGAVIKAPFKVALLKFLAYHILNTPVYGMRYTLLRTIGEVEKIGNVSRTKLLLPLLSLHHLRDEELLRASCSKEGIDIMQYCLEIARVVSPSDREGNETLENILRSKEVEFSKTYAQAALQHVRDSWLSMRTNIRHSWSIVLFDLGVLFLHTELETTLAKEAREVLRSVQLSADLLLMFLGRLPQLLLDTGSQSPNAKRRRTVKGSSSRNEETSSEQIVNRLKATTQVLEYIESSEEGNHPQLLPNLFQLLHDIQKSAFAFQNDMSYTQSLLLNSIRRAVEQAQKMKLTETEKGMRVDLVVDCLRTTPDPQVQQSALLLLSSLASLLPEVIVHSVMPVFTLMATGVLRRNDDYSAHVVDQTIQSIIPPLIASFRKQKGSALSGAAELITNFVAAFDHLLPHRRLELFAALTDKLGSEEYLYMVFVILQDRNGDKGVTSEFINAMMTQHSPVLQIKTIQKCLDVGLDLLQPKPKFANKIFAHDKERDQEAHVLKLFGLPSMLLRTPRLAKEVDKLLQNGGIEALEIRTSYSHMVEQLLNLLNEKFSSKSLKSAAQDLLASLLNFLSMPESLKSLDILLEQGSDEVRRQVLKTFEKRIDSAVSGDSATEKACLQLLSRFSSLLERCEDLALKRTATACIDLIVEKYGKKDPLRTFDIARTVAGPICFESNDSQLQVLALLSMATLIEVLREAILPLMPGVLTKSLDHLSAAMESTESDYQLHNAVYSLFSALFLYIPWIVTGTHLDRLLELSHRSTEIGFSSETDRMRNGTLDLIAKQVDPHECFSVLQRTWTKALLHGLRSCTEHLEILEKAIERSPKATIFKESQLLVSLFLDITDVRIIKQKQGESSAMSEQHVQETENLRNQIMIKTIYKLNDTHFRPLFTKMMEWAGAVRGTEKGAKLLRQSSWFSFLHDFFDTLKSIVTSYAAHVVDMAVDLLNEVTPSEPEYQVLWDRVIKTLHAAFEHDQDEFWKSPSYFAQVCDPLLAQLKHASPTQQHTLESTLIPAITSFANAADSHDHLKDINVKLLTHMRSDRASVRLAAIRTQISLTDNLGEEWLNLLPEMLPIISETMEDDDENVEAEVRKWAKQIEDVLGESLDSMLQ